MLLVIGEIRPSVPPLFGFGGFGKYDRTQSHETVTF